MTALARLPETAAATPITAVGTAAGAAFTVETVDTLEVVEPLWRELQDEGVSSPYQRFDWVRAYVDAHAAADGFTPRILVVRDLSGRPSLLLPLAVERRAGLRIARLIGGKQANYGMPLMAAGARPSAAELRTLLREVGARALRLDAFLFATLPLAWRGVPNPLAEGGHPSPSDGYRLALDADPDATLKRAFSSQTRGKLRRKERLLEGIGPVRHVRAGTAAEVDTILATFLAQKRHRFRAQGIPDVFAAPAPQEFLRAGCLAGLANGTPAIELHALFAGERIVATFGAAVDRFRWSAMFNSFDASPETARSSPGDLLLRFIIEEQCRRGRSVFDLGVGEAHYKNAICDESEPLVDSTLGVSMRGRLYAVAAEGGREAKRFVKRTPWLWALARRLRTLKRRR